MGKTRNRSRLMCKNNEHYCVCPECGTGIPYKFGTSCKHKLCPECGARMISERQFHDNEIKKQLLIQE